MILSKYENRMALNTISMLKPYIKPSDTVLDIGSGTGLVAECICKNIGSPVVCMDVIDINQSSMNVVVYDGKYLPFGDNAFSVILCCYVLHHSQNPIRLLTEMKRVARDKIIIMEDTPCSTFDQMFIYTHKMYSKYKYHMCAKRFLCKEKWNSIFKHFHLSIEENISIPRLRWFLYPVTRTMFVLGNTDHFK